MVCFDTRVPDPGFGGATFFHRKWGTFLWPFWEPEFLSVAWPNLVGPAFGAKRGPTFESTLARVGARRVPNFDSTFEADLRKMSGRNAFLVLKPTAKRHFRDTKETHEAPRAAHTQKPNQN